MDDLLRLARQHSAMKEEGYLRAYAELLAPYRERDLRLLELGINAGGSLLLWRDWFPRGTISGLDDKRVVLDDPSGRIRTWQGLQDDTALLDRLAAADAPGGFDIIIDDASHCGAPSKVSFWHLFTHHLKPGGLYVIEDWATAYMPSWGDGAAYVPAADMRSFANHHNGMAGFVKELLDECATAAVTKRLYADTTHTIHPIARLTVFPPGQIAVWKKADAR